MTGEATGLARTGLTAGQLDVLELVRTGALQSYPLGAPAGSVRLDLPGAPAATVLAGQVELTDLEGVPVASMPVETGSGPPRTAGIPMWLATRSSRPFEAWHRGPGDVGDISGVVALRGPVDPGTVGTALDRAGSRPLLLLLISVDGDVDPAALDTAYLARGLLRDRPSTTVAVAPATQPLSPAEQDAVVRSYAQGRPVTFLEAAQPVGPGVATGTVLFFTGLSGSGKSTLARAVRNRLIEAGRRVTLLDGDIVRRHLSAGLGFSAADRATNIRRIGWVAAEVAHHGGTAICSPIAPYEQDRQEVRRMVEGRGGRLVLVHVATPLAECERRDRKGLYARARRGEVADFTGISAPYEEPAAPDLRLDTTGGHVDALVDDVLAVLDAGMQC